MNGSVVFSNDVPPPSLANATSSTATRPVSLSAGGRVRGVRYAKRGSAGVEPYANLDRYERYSVRANSGGAPRTADIIEPQADVEARHRDLARARPKCA